MKQIFTSFCFLFFAAGFLNAQNNEAVSVEIPILQKDLPTGDISSIEVVSNLGDSIFIGVLPSSFPNVRTNVIISGGVRSWLQDYIDQAFNNSFNVDGKKLLWVINALRVGKDSSGAGTISFIKFSADVYSDASDVSQLQNSFDTTLISFEPNADLGEQLAIAINATYNLSASAAAAMKQLQPGQVANRSLISSGLTQPTEISDSFKILTESVYQTGVFKSFQEFLDNVPSVTNFYASVDSGSNEVKLYEFSEDSTAHLIANPWGISINNELYRYQEGQLYAIEKDGNAFTLSKYLDYRSRKNQAFFWRRYIGERQGDNNPYNDAHVYRASLDINPAIKIEATQLNMSTGEISID